MKHPEFMQRLMEQLSQTEVAFLFAQLNDEGHLDDDQAKAAALLISDIRSATVDSQRIRVAKYTDRSTRASKRNDKGNTDAISSINAMSSHLRPYERQKLLSMMSVSGKRGCVHEISTSRKYTTPKYRKAYAVAEALSVLSAIAEAYRCAETVK